MKPEEFDYNLRAAFEYNPQKDVGIEDVEKVVAEWDDGADEPSFVWLLKLKGKKGWAVARGSHDYTGWDCQSCLDVTVWPTKKVAIYMGLTLNDRENLNLLLSGEKIK